VGNTLGDIKKKLYGYQTSYRRRKSGDFSEIISISFILDSENIPASWWSAQSLPQLDEGLKIKCIIIKLI
jgi:hypothetical protein